jgi:23S rRNA (guanine745-N1)-methyltransferase
VLSRRAAPLWWCPVCHGALTAASDGRVLLCPAGHSYDIARQGYVNLLWPGERRARGDSAEMVAARQAFLASGAYEPLSDALNEVCARLVQRATVLDVGCGDGYYTRRLATALGEGASVSGVDLAKTAVASAAGQHRAGQYAVGSAFNLPVPPGAVDLALSVFGPIAAEELARVVHTGGAVVAAHPGPDHLFSLRALVYETPAHHKVKDPLRTAREWFRPVSEAEVVFPLTIDDATMASQLLTMTPYRWHAPRDIHARLRAAGGLRTSVDVVISGYRRLG